METQKYKCVPSLTVWYESLRIEEVGIGKKCPRPFLLMVVMETLTFPEPMTQVS